MGTALAGLECFKALRGRGLMGSGFVGVSAATGFNGMSGATGFDGMSGAADFDGMSGATGFNGIGSTLIGFNGFMGLG
jgi:hypothetical protein